MIGGQWRGRVHRERREIGARREGACGMRGVNDPVVVIVAKNRNAPSASRRN